MYGYDASRAGPADYGQAGGHGHGAGHQQQPASTWQQQQHGEHQQGHGNGYIDYGKHQPMTQAGHRDYGVNTSSPSQAFGQPRQHNAGNDDYGQQQQRQASYRYDVHHGSQNSYDSSGPSRRPPMQSNARPSGTEPSFCMPKLRLADQHSSIAVTATSPYTAGNSYTDANYPSSSSSYQRYDQHFSPNSGYIASQAGASTAEGLEHRVPARSPTLPALKTSANAAGFGNLFQQFGVEIDQTQANRTPVATPEPSRSANLTPQALGRHAAVSGSNNAPGVPQRQDSGITVRGDAFVDQDASAYGASGIISMYDPRIPSPIPDARGHPNSQGTFANQPSSSSQAAYQPYINTVSQAAPFPVAAASGSYRQPPVSTSDRQRRPSGSGRVHHSASSLKSNHSDNSFTPPLPYPDSVVQLPSSSSSANKAPPSSSSVRSASSRPSQESNSSYFSSSSRSQYPAGPSNGTVAPRPSMSSSVASRPSMNFGESSQARVRPLPIPHANDQEHEQLAQQSSYMASPDIYESLPPIRERMRSDFSNQSDFSRDFYNAGTSAPESVKQRTTSVNRPPPSTGGRHPVADRYRVVPQQSDQHHGSGSRKAGGSIAEGAPSISSLSGASISSTNYLSSSPAPMPYTTSHPPHMVHSHSDPSADSRASSSSSRARQISNQALVMSNTRTPTLSTSRSASFSSSAAKERSEFARRTVSARSNSTTRNAQGRVAAMPEPSPPLPSSPSISISTSFHDTSISSAYSTLSTAPSQSTYTSAMRKQASMSPSNLSLSAQGFLSSRNPRDAERERRRLEGLGLQHLNPALLSNLAVAFKDRIPRTLNVKGSVHYPSSFTGEQAVTCLAEILPFPYTDDRRIAWVIARNLHRNMFFNEVDWDDAQPLRDSQERVYCFQDDEEQATIDYLNGNAAGMGVYSPSARAPDISNGTNEIPNGVITRFTKCYSPFCGMEGTSGSGACYSLYCPNGSHPVSGMSNRPKLYVR